MDHLVQAAFLLMESHKRQQAEIARLKQKAASADEALGCLDRLRADVETLKKKVDDADVATHQLTADRDDAIKKLADEKEAHEATRCLAVEAEKARAEAERAAEVAAEKVAYAAIEKFLVD
ncbi:unnamed protein product, partial [Cuscuta europaea]